ncbi:MAG: GEVED domain-containing protein [Candidatus Nanohaloarchaea archaeon]
MEMTRKGFYFSMDAVVALMVMSASMMLVMQISDSASSQFQTESSEYRKLGTTGRDAMKLASAQDLTALNESLQDYIRPTVGEEAMTKSVLNGISLLWARGNRTAAQRVAKAYFGQKIPENYEFAVNISESGESYLIYRSKMMQGAPQIVTSTSTLVSGHMINKSSTGYRARALLTEVDKNATKRVFMGGYVGQGVVTYNVSLEDMDEAQNVTVKADFSGPFDLYFNGEPAGSYSYSPGNLTVDKYMICTDNVNESRCNALRSGNNNITFNFTGANRSIRGGVLRIKYNKTQQIEASGGKYIQDKRRLPGLNGIINYYGSFYVPGELNNLSAELHYKVDNRTVFMRMGNTTVYKNHTDGEKTVTLDNQEISEAFEDSKINYSSLGRDTVPLRIGLGNISENSGLEGAVADSVSVMDVSGSMGCSFFEDPPCKIDKAINASKLFVDIILNASGNRAGFVSYNGDVVDSHELSDNETSLKQLIDSQTASGGTCIGCGILNATEILLEPYILDVFRRGASWNYTTDYLDSRPPVRDGSSWTSVGYNESDWSNGSALIGTVPGAETVLSRFEGSVYLRREFMLNYSNFKKFELSLRSNDAATVYLNGEMIYNGTSAHQGRYWNQEVTLNGENLREGKNVVAVKLKNAENDTERWQVDTNSEWDNGTFNGTETNQGNLQLSTSFSGSGSDINANNYCQVQGGFTQYEYIYSVSFNGINRVTGDNKGYIDATDSITDPLVPGRSYRLNVTFAQTNGYDEYATVAFDWDGDGNISETTAQKVGTCSSDMCTVSTEVKVPKSAAEGSTLMRVIGEYNQYHYDSCTNPNYNEMEDYSAYVSEPVYTPGNYTSAQLDTTGEVNWTDIKTKKEVPENTSIELDFSNGLNWFDNLSQVPNSDTLRFNATLNTTNESVTPKIDKINIGYLVNESEASFDAALNLTGERRRSMVVMSDGNPNIATSMTNVPDHDGDGDTTDDPQDHTVEAACRAYQQHDIKVYTVGFGSGANEQLLNQTAKCGNGKYYYANSTELEEVFRNISKKILEASYVGQSVKSGTQTSKSILYPDSYIQFNYTGNEGLEFGKIKLKMNTGKFGGEVKSPKEETVSIPNGTAFVPQDTEVESAKVSSYSGNRWTYIVEANGSGSFKNVFNLSDYGSNFQDLGDPFKVSIPEKHITVGTNAVKVDTAVASGESEGGSPANRVFYTLQFGNSVGYGKLYPNKTKALANAKERLRKKLDFDGDGEPIVDVSSDDFKTSSNVLGDEPYLWGPANVKLVIWSNE